ncbi:hypothetical protein [Lacicoccus qingdaonensis]|uniref:Uncharacterized protein n=1 Tax=Lacicoccus qingdaonensis TaxID=576118 RepID=A0A1G9EZN4_9BACL|nr:hypothetical protein [Salinicoccus qingdaonensis]SDK81503.1 hypothetical protein SAMN05216216_11061 [Salinicoccus qingdaonensis]
MTRPESQRPKWSKHQIHPDKPPVEQQNEASRKAYDQEMDHYERYLKALNKDNGIGRQKDD